MTRIVIGFVLIASVVSPALAQRTILPPHERYALRVRNAQRDALGRQTRIMANRYGVDARCWSGRGRLQQAATMSQPRLEQMYFDRIRDRSTQASTAASQRPFRTWTDSTGQFTVRARLVDLDEHGVVLERVDRKRVRVDLQRLSQRDFEWATTRVLAGHGSHLHISGGSDRLTAPRK